MKTTCVELSAGQLSASGFELKTTRDGLSPLRLRAPGFGSAEMMTVWNRVDATPWCGRFQETPGLAEGARTVALCSSRHHADARISTRLHAKSTLSVGASIPANIAEGRSHKSENEFARFLGYAVHSATELEYHLILARDTDRIAESDFVSLVSQTITVRKMLYGLLKRLAASDPPPSQVVFS